MSMRIFPSLEEYYIVFFRVLARAALPAVFSVSYCLFAFFRVNTKRDEVNSLGFIPQTMKRVFRCSAVWLATPYSGQIRMYRAS
jgi:hypothetical protein